MATYYVDFENGNDGNNGTSFALRKKTIASLTGATAGDVIRVMADKGVVNTIANCTFTNKSGTITLGSARTANIYDDGAWTSGNGNVTCATNTTYRKLGSNASSIVFAAGFTTGKAAYFPTGTLDLSGYTGISFWLYASAAVAANTLRIDLCSDTAGATPVDSFTIPYALTTGMFHQVTLYKGSALGSSIKSIALNCLLDPATVTLYIDNVLAVNANDLHLGSLVCKQSEESVNNIGLLYPVKNISGTTVVLDAPTGYATTTVRGYSGVTEVTTLSVYEPIRPGVALPNNAYWESYAGSSGSAGNLVTISGGWDRTDMSTQTGATIVDLTGDLVSGSPYLIRNNNNTYLKFERLGVVNGAFWSASSYIDNSVFLSCYSSGNRGGTFLFPTPGAAGQSINTTYDSCVLIGGGIGLGSTTYNPGNCTYKDCYILSCLTYGLQLGYSGYQGNMNVLIDGCVCRNNGTANIQSFGFVTVSNCTVSDSSYYGLMVGASNCFNITCVDNANSSIMAVGSIKIYGLTSSGTTLVKIQNAYNGSVTIYDGYISDTNIFSGEQGSFVKLHRRSGDPHANERHELFGVLKEQNSVIPPEVSYAWEFAVKNAYAKSDKIALGLLEPFLYAIPCKANVTTTISMQTRNDNANLKLKFIVYGGRYPGVGSYGTDITVDATPSAINTWETKSISVTPTEDCVIDLYVLAYDSAGGTTRKGYVAGPVTISES